MSDTETVAVEQEVQETQEVAEQPQQPESNEAESVVEEVKEQNVPLSALQKERRKRQEAEAENRILREYGQKQKQPEPEEDESQYEAMTKGEYLKREASMKTQYMREIEEKLWMKQNPEKAELINEKLSDFLKQKPNLVSAINAATNRYEEAWELMDKLTPKQKIALNKPPVVKKDAPGSPGSIPKSAGMNEAIDLMNMSDSEFAAWRQSKRKR